MGAMLVQVRRRQCAAGDEALSRGCCCGEGGAALTCKQLNCCCTCVLQGTLGVIANHILSR